PGYYDVGFPRRPGNHKPPPFLSSAPCRSKQQERRLTACDSGVGPGSYNLDVKEMERKYKMPHVRVQILHTEIPPPAPQGLKHTAEEDPFPCICYTQLWTISS
ncbi:hypothetical protein CRUP_026195, partial [Coryphaenoides rupestris]